MTTRAFYDLPAPAKLNLFLHVVGRRPDGYHLLQSVFTLIDWADTLHVERRDDGQLRRHDLGPALPELDLCLKAARALQQASGTAWGVDLSVDKLVPWGAGMGGGSSDAATTLLALNRLWQLDWPLERLLELGLQLGADVPFFLGGHNAFVEGIGERLTPIELPPAGYAVVKPAEGIATAALFSSPLLTRDHEPVIVTGFLADLQKLDCDAFGGGFEAFGNNDLQPAAEALCPAVQAAGQWLQARFGNSRMTGSGSAVFARVDTSGMGVQPVATGPQGELQGLPSGWVGRLCRGLSAHPMAGWARRLEPPAEV